ncbi:MAG: hypothetical protein II805_01660, partial [Candidatus Methanomethylophilus sp.]|nr:hypothetical protein [Methanomethylophilus sp.]
MELYRNKGKIAMLALLSVMAVLLAGIVLCDTENVRAETTSGNVMDGTTDVGDWRINGTTLDIVSDSTAATFTELDGYESTSSPSITLVTVKGFLNDTTDVLRDASIGIDASVPIQYYGDIPSYTLKSDSTNYCSNRGIGVWTYDLSSKALTLTRSTSTSNMGLISYESDAINTIFHGYFFLDVADSVLITGYESYGGYIFHEFTALKTFRSIDHLTLGNVNLLKGVGFE